MSSAKTLGQYFRECRERQGVTIVHSALGIGIDPTLLSRIETDQRRPTREQLFRLAEFFHLDRREMLIHWLSEKLIQELKEDSPVALAALHAAEAKLVSQAQTNPNAKVN